MRRVIACGMMLALAGLTWSCSSRKEGTCEKDSHCKGAEVCFEEKCVSMKDLEEIKKQREEEARPKVCKDNDGDGARAGKDCPEGTTIDCNDEDPNVAPGKTEVCDGVDNDCDGMVNEGMKGCVQTLFGGATWGNQETHRLDNPRSVLYDPEGFVLVTDNHHVWKVHLDGRVEVFAGSHLSNFADATGEEARFSYPGGITAGPDGSFYVADSKNNCIRRLDRIGAAQGVAGLCSNLTKNVGQYADGAGPMARFYGPADVAFGPDGTLIVVDRENARIRKMTTDGMVSTVAGLGPVEVEEGEGQIGFQDGPAHEARFNDPQSVLVDPKGIIYVSESFNCRIRRIDPQKGEHGEVSTFLGESDTLLGVGGHVDGAGKAVKFSYPHGMIWDGKGNILIADTGNSAIRRVTLRGQAQTVYGKACAGKEEYRDGPIEEACFATPMDLALGPDGSLFVVDTAAGRLRWIVP